MSEITETNNNEKDLRNYATICDTNFFKTGYLRFKSCYAPRSLLKPLRVDLRLLRQVEPTVAIRYFANEKQLEAFVSEIPTLNRTLMKLYNDRKYFSNDKIRPPTREFNLTLSGIALNRSERSDELLWSCLLPGSHIGPSDIKQSEAPPKPARRKSLIKVRERLAPTKLKPGPIVTKFVAETDQGKIDLNQLTSFDFDEAIFNDLIQVKGLEAAFIFLAYYGTDFLQCDYYRHRVSYRACRVTAFNEPGWSEPTQTDLTILALHALGGSSTSSFDTSFPMRGQVVKKFNYRNYEFEFYTGTVLHPIFEPVKGCDFKWVPIWSMVQRFWERHPRFMAFNISGYTPVQFIHDAWLFRSVMADCRVHFNTEFCLRYPPTPTHESFKFLTYWDDCLAIEVKRVVQNSYKRSSNVEEETHLLNLSRRIEKAAEDVYNSDLAFMHVLYRCDWFFLGRDQNVRETLLEIEKENRVVVLFYTRQRRLTNQNMFMRLFKNIIIFINIYNGTKGGNEVPFAGLIVDENIHPKVAKLFPETVQQKFTIDGDLLKLEVRPDPKKKLLKYKGLNLLTLKSVVYVPGYTWLDASCNLLCFLDISLGHLRNLKILDLSSNSLEYFTDRPFSELSQLETLNLSKNIIKIIPHPDFFDGLDRLKRLDLSWNKLTGLKPRVFLETESLEVLLLGHNHFKTIDLLELNYMKNLTILDLSFNHLEFLTGMLILPNLKQLFLNNNRLDEIVPNVLSHISKIELINVSYNYLTSIRENMFSGLSRLEVLFLNSNRLHWVCESAFLYCNRLKFISLASNRLIHIPANVFIGPMLGDPNENERSDEIFYQMKAGHYVMEETPLRALLLYDNLLEENPRVFKWRLNHLLFALKSFDPLKYVMMRWDNEKSLKVSNSKHFVKFKDIIRYEFSRYMLDKLEKSIWSSAMKFQVDIEEDEGDEDECDDKDKQIEKK